MFIHCRLVVVIKWSTTNSNDPDADLLSLPVASKPPDPQTGIRLSCCQSIHSHSTTAPVSASVRFIKISVCSPRKMRWVAMVWPGCLGTRQARVPSGSQSINGNWTITQLGGELVVARRDLWSSHQSISPGRPQGHSWSCDEMSIRICSCWSVKICYPLLFIWALETLQLIIPHKQNHFNRNEREAPQSLLTRWDLVVGQTTNWWIRKRHNSIRILLATRDTHTRGYPRWQVPVAGSKRRSVSSV